MTTCPYKPHHQDYCETEVSEVGEFCQKHKFISCANHEKIENADGSFFWKKCSEKATIECSQFRGSYVCGMPLCATHFQSHKQSHAFS